MDMQAFINLTGMWAQIVFDVAQVCAWCAVVVASDTAQGLYVPCGFRDNFKTGYAGWKASFMEGVTRPSCTINGI